MRLIPFSLLCMIATSCSMYNTQFDCPPGKGLGCTPVSEVLDLIVEKEEGEDLFVQDLDKAKLLKAQEKRKKRGKNCPENKKLYLFKERSGDPVLVEEGQR